MRLALVAFLVAGCGYTSQYAPPSDGRPRAVWHKDKVVLHAAGVVPTGECMAAVTELSGDLHLAPPPPPSGYYSPRWYGPPLVMLQPGIAPPILRPPIFFSPSLALASTARTGGHHASGLSLDAGRGGGSSGGGGKGLEAAAVYLAVVALLTLPIIDTALALAPAENARDSARAIDDANALNDLLRWPGSPCAPPPAIPAPQ